jgi:transcriptional regulator with XRE-family HTH domain
VIQTSDVSKLIGERLRKERLKRGLSMAVAREVRQIYCVKIDSSYLSRIELGKTEIPLRTLFALADYYEVQVSELTTGIEWVLD